MLNISVTLRLPEAVLGCVSPHILVPRPPLRSVTLGSLHLLPLFLLVLVVIDGILSRKTWALGRPGGALNSALGERQRLHASSGGGGLYAYPDRVHLRRLRKYHWHLLWEYRARMLGNLM